MTRARRPPLPLLLLLGFVAGCATRTAPAPSSPVALPAAPATSGAPPAAPVPRSTLAAEQVRLAELFRGTPVVFSLQQDGSLRATVPLRFSFDAGASTVKPPLAAVLDRLAKSQAQVGSRLRASAPADPPARGGTLARERALSVRDHLVRQGIAVTRVSAVSAASSDQVEIVVSEAR